MKVLDPAREHVESPHRRELEALLREHAAARGEGQLRVALVRGPAGVGKSALLSRTRLALGADGVRAFEASPAPGAFGLFRSLLPELLALLAESGTPRRVLDALAERCGPVRGGPARTSSDEAPLELADAMAELFALAGRFTPCFLLADLERADLGSLALLRYLLAAAQAPGSEAGGLFVLAFRDDAPLPAPLSEIAGRVSGITLSLRGLDLEGIRGFLARRDVAERLLELTGGNPAALEQVISSAAPLRPGQLFLRRIEALDPSERATLAALAIAQVPAEAAELAGIVAETSGQAPIDLDVRLRRLVAARILVSVGARFEFARPSDREVLLDSLAEVERVALHRAWGHRLSTVPMALERAALHLLTADPTGRGWEVALQAAEALAGRLACDDALALYLRALPFVPRARQAEVHRAAGELSRALGDHAAALGHLGRWRRAMAPAERGPARVASARVRVTLGKLASGERLLRAILATKAPELSASLRCEAAAELCEVLFLRGNYAAAAALAQSVLDGGAPSEVAYPLCNTLGKVSLAQAEYAEAARLFEANAARALASADPRAWAQATLNRGVVAHRRGDKRAAVAFYREALPQLDRKGEAHALSNLGSLYAESGEFEPAVEHLARGLQAFTRARRPKEIAHCAGNLARLELFLGDLTRAAQLQEHMGAQAALVGDPYLVASAGLIGAQLQEARGEGDRALVSYRAAREAFEALGAPRYAAEAALGAARAAILQGERAEARLELVAQTVEAQGRVSSAIAVERELLGGELCLLQGELPEATRRLLRAKELLLAEPDLEGPYRCYALLARLRLACGDPSGASADLARAARLLEELLARVPPLRRAAFAQLPRRASVLALSAEREITPAQVHRALDLGPSSAVPVALIGRCEPIQRVLRMVGPIARANTTVLIRGESGTGKELIAEAIHQGSSRREMPLVRVNCAAMVEELLLSELFGHEKGAFTGAVRERKGRFELADGGTIFLDEIGDLSPKAQVALLRALQERTFERVGGTRTLTVDVRVVCATHRDLEGMIAAGQFRADLYYRLKGVMLELPPLRARGDDLSLLCSHVLEAIARARREEVKQLSPEALALLAAHPFPGNVRELENVLESATLFATGRVVGVEAFEHLPELRATPTVAAPPPIVARAIVDPAPVPAAAVPAEIDYFELVRRRGLSLKDLRQEIETHCIARALGEAGGNISGAARLLQMKRSRLSQIVNADLQLRGLARGDSGEGVDFDDQD
jgi:transcriptional regulator with GAF, ATPase, and Fis domain/tetratricopeptide (TPR) repeat protein